LQTDHYTSSPNHRTTAAFVIRTTLAEEGPRGLFRGFWTIAARDCPFMVILLTTYENFKAFHHRSVRKDLLEKMHRAHPHSPAVVAGAALEDLEADIPTLNSILFGGVSGFLAGYFTTPMDVMRTRMITYRRSAAIASGSSSVASVAVASPSAVSMSEVARQILRSALARNSATSTRPTVMGDAVRVYRAFFVGALPRSLWWFGICSIFFPVYEGMKSVLDGSQVEEVGTRKVLEYRV
ncbi:mitochondrial carrier domain-containing protein, partial [Jimgerdemannia flammicorona]